MSDLFLTESISTQIESKSFRYLKHFELNMKFDGVKIIDDAKDDVEYIKEVIKTKDQEDAFYVLDIGDVINKHRTWRSQLPRVEPHFAMKCNPDPTVVKTLAALNASFDCASKYEIEQALSNGVSNERIIFANPVKLPSHIKFARKVGVNLLTVDSESELYKIKDFFPEAKIIIRFHCDSTAAETTFGSKCGCDSVNEAPQLIRQAKDLGLRVYGFSFHVGTNCTDTTAWTRGIRISVDLIEYAKSLGFKDVELIDIGGGFPGDKDHPIDRFAEAINEVLDEIDPSIKVISEPGRYYVASAFTLASRVFGKRIVNENNGTRYMYYINDGTYGSFFEVALNLKTPMPFPLTKLTSEETFPSTFWGPTCDTIDCVVRNCNFPELNIGDWLGWTEMGAYTLSLAGNFNGLFPSVVFPFIRRNQWNSFWEERSAKYNGLVNGGKNHRKC